MEFKTQLGIIIFLILGLCFVVGAGVATLKEIHKALTAGPVVEQEVE